VTIERRQVYTVKYRPRHGPKYPARQVWRGTLKGAASALAWRMIWDKYDSFKKPRAMYGQSLIDYRYPPHLTCNCDQEKEVYDCGTGPYTAAGWVDCPIHDHETGYYRRLHDRLAAFIVSTIRAQEVSGE